MRLIFSILAAAQVRLARWELYQSDRLMSDADAAFVRSQRRVDLANDLARRAGFQVRGQVELKVRTKRVPPLHPRPPRPELLRRGDGRGGREETDAGSLASIVQSPTTSGPRWPTGTAEGSTR